MLSDKFKKKNNKMYINKTNFDICLNKLTELLITWFRETQIFVDFYQDYYTNFAVVLDSSKQLFLKDQIQKS